MRTALLVLPAALLLVTASPQAAAPVSAPAACAPKDDFLVRSDPLLAPVRPADCEKVVQSPPEFTWPPQDGENTYELALTFPDGRVEKRTTTRNWLLWNEPLPPGAYSWRVNVRGNANHAGKARTFTVANGALAFVVPEAAALLKTAHDTPRPRTWSRDASQPMAALKRERAAGLHKMLLEVDNKRTTPVQPEPLSGSENANYEDTVAEQKRTLAAALAWAATGQRGYAADAARRLLAQARWNTEGSLSYRNNDMGNRTVAWTLAVGYDWLHDYLEPAQKELLRTAIRARTQPMFEDVMARLGKHPYDSHGNVTLTLVAAIGALMAGELPEADRWLAEALPLAATWTSPWGGADGGFANGTGQLFWDVGSNVPAWMILRNAAGVDLSRKPWVREVARFMAYIVPPGAPEGPFGDGHELKLSEVWARVPKALARFAPTPIGRWYAGARDGEDPGRIEVLLSARDRGGPAPLPEGTPNAAHFPSVGWAAMHSDLADPARTSIYFKSSPYGSYNHAHADQNGFVVHDRGRPLAIASGYYDGYRTPHWERWYKQTRAANAITFDGGQGQKVNDRAARGAITRFETHATHDVVTGDATAAYGGALTRAQRTLVYVRPGVVVVHDRLASETPRRWEWNLHSPERMEVVAENRVLLRNGPARLCLEQVAGPATSFDQSDRFDPAPQGKYAPQWHGAFRAREASTEAEFVVVMRVGEACDGAREATRAEREADGWRIELPTARVQLAAAGVEVKRRDRAPAFARGDQARSAM